MGVGLVLVRLSESGVSIAYEMRIERVLDGAALRPAHARRHFFVVFRSL